MFFRTSGLSVAPQLLGTREIAADPKTGELLLSDPVAGILRLSDLKGLRKLPGAVTAGPGGDYPSVSEAVEVAVAAVPAGVPAVVVIAPGSLSESIVVPPAAWVQIVALGRVLVRAPAGPALKVSGQDKAARIELYDLDLTSLEPGPVVVLQGGTGKVSLEVSGCRVFAEDARSPLVLVGGGFDVALDRCILHSPGTALSFEAAGLSLAGCAVRGDLKVAAKTLAFDQVQATALSSLRVMGSEVAGLRGSRFRDLVLGGAAEVENCTVDHLELEDGAQVVASLSNVKRVTPTQAAALDLDRLAGEASFAGSNSLQVLFDVPRTTADYQVSFVLHDRPAGDEVPWLSKRRREGFELRFLSPQTVGVGWMIMCL